MDFLPTGSGLIAIGLPAPHLEIWNGYSGAGVFAPPNVITSIVVVDEAHAWCTVKGDGLYYSFDAWRGWQNILTGPSLRLLYASKSLIEVNNGIALQYSINGVIFHSASGILPGDSITSIDRISSKVLVAAGGFHLYQSTDGGASWSPSRTDPRGASQSVYVDPSTGYAFAGGGDTARVSKDSGATWLPLQEGLFANLAGQIVGTHDCSGVWYLTPNYLRNSMLRTESHGDYLQDVGPASAASIKMIKTVVTDRGSNVYWLDESGLLWLDSTGIDGSLTQPTASSIVIQPPDKVQSDLCSATATNFVVAFSSTNCDTLIIDSIALLRASGIVRVSNAQAEFSNALTDSVRLSYTSTKLGVDSVKMRVWVHSKLDSRIGFKNFAFPAVVVAAPAKMALAASTILFGATRVDSSRASSFFLYNRGCEALRVDSIVSSDPQTFPPDKLIFPLAVKGADSIGVTVSFHPHSSGEFIEALEIGTSSGHGFVELRGTGATQARVVNDRTASIAIYPNPTRVFLKIQTSKTLTHVDVLDLLGRNVLDCQPTPIDHVINVSSLPAGAYFLSVAGVPPIPFVVSR